MTILWTTLLTAACWTTALAVFSLRHYSHTGPRVKQEIHDHFLTFSILAFVRLLAWSFAILAGLALASGLLYGYLTQIWPLPDTAPAFIIAETGGIIAVTCSLFCYYLIRSPSLLTTSLQFRFSRLNPLWKHLKAHGRILAIGATSAAAALWVLSLWYAYRTDGPYGPGLLMTVLVTLVYLAWRAKTRIPENPVSSPPEGDPARPNVILIGSDTLRTDRLGHWDYIRNLTPNLDTLAERGVLLTNCYTPLARTAPSLTSLLTGTWPHHHGIRTNFPSAEQLTLPVPNLVELLNQAGYETVAVTDWAGADLGKIRFGLRHLDVPPDQWNLKYLIRQGPAALRLFLSLFCHNRFGKRFLPEIYYLAGVPLTHQTFTQARQELSRLAASGRPFFLHLFTATTHVPFGSDYPYYDLFTREDYQGESRFVMTKLASPEEIIRKQEFGPEAFDTDQIINLYDGCVVQFDDEVGKLLEHLQCTGLAENTIVMVYSDHGADFFETGCWGQGNTVLGDDPSARVPVIIYDPRGTLPQGVRLQTSTRTVDLAPTLLDLLDLEIPGAMDGISLVPFLSGTREPENLPAFQETGLWFGKIPTLPERHLHYPNLMEILDIPDKDSGMLIIRKEWYPCVVAAKDRSVRLGNWKLVRIALVDGPCDRLHHLADDPHCRRDVAGEYPEIFQRLKSLMDAWLADDPFPPSRPGNAPCATSPFSSF